METDLRHSKQKLQLIFLKDLLMVYNYELVRKDFLEKMVEHMEI